MAYTTPDEVRLVLTRNPTQTAGNAASLSDTTIESEINSAQQRVDGRLALVYLVPFADPVPTLIRDITRDIAAYLSDLTFREVRDYGSELNPVYLRYKDALALLEQIATGKTTVPGDPVPPESEAGSQTVVATFDGGQQPLGDFFDERRPGDGPIGWVYYG
jgi:phage gp36-like protein